MSDGARMVAVDPSTRKTGISLFINGEFYEANLIDLSSHKGTTDERINAMGANLILLLSKWDPHIVYIEAPKGHGRNLEVVRKISEIMGIVRGWCIDNSRHYEEITPSEWRSYLGFKQGYTMKRTDLKREGVLYVRNKYGILVNDDVADSVCIGDAMIKKYTDKKEN